MKRASRCLKTHLGDYYRLRDGTWIVYTMRGEIRCYSKQDLDEELREINTIKP